MANFDEVFDWVVVGSGAGSICSSLQMRKMGKTSVVLEKTALFGGSTCKSGGAMWIPNNRYMDPGEDSREKALTYLEALIEDGPDSPGTSREKRQAYVDEAPRMADFLVENGVPLERGSRFWPDYYDEYPGGCKTSRTVTALPFNKNELGPWADKIRQGCFPDVPATLDQGMRLQWIGKSWAIKLMFAKIAARVVLGKLTGKRWVTAGAALQGRMLQAGLKAGVDVRLNASVKELIVENDRVVGVVVLNGGKTLRIGAKLGVLVNAGGFAHNQAMRDKYQPGTRAEWSNTPEGDTGDMHLEMERIGGVLAQMDEFVGCQMTRAPGWEGDYVKPGMQATLAKPHAILVDQSGVRYMNECGSYELFCETQVKRHMVVPAIPSWGILESRVLEKYKVGLQNSPKIFEAWQQAGHLKKADTIEGLALQINVEPAQLRATVDRWNGFVEKGADEDFHRGERAYDHWLGDPYFTDGPNANMGKIEQGPFYAVDVVPGDVSTFGGAVTDVNSRVLRADGTAIEGLYATGVSTASAMGRVYPGAGTSVAPSMLFGWLAARHATGTA